MSGVGVCTKHRDSGPVSPQDLERGWATAPLVPIVTRKLGFCPLTWFVLQERRAAEEAAPEISQETPRVAAAVLEGGDRVLPLPEGQSPGSHAFSFWGNPTGLSPLLWEGAGHVLFQPMGSFRILFRCHFPRFL